MKRMITISTIALAIAIILGGCSNKNNASNGGASVSFGLALRSAQNAPAVPIMCAGEGGVVSTVEAILYNRSDYIIKTAGPWACTAHQGTIANITTNSTNVNMKLLIYTRDANGNILHSGDTGYTLNITQAGQTYDAGTVALYPFMAWSISTINGNAPVGMYSSIVSDPSVTGTVHIVYSSAADSSLHYAADTSGNWVDSIIDGPNVGQFPSLAMDASKKLHVSYYDQANGNLKYATNATGTWVAITVDNSANDVGKESSLSLDGAGKVHISYYDATAKTLRYVTNAGGSWGAPVTVDGTPDVGIYSSISAVSATNVHIAYYDKTNGDLKYAKWDGAYWQAVPIDSTGDVGHFPSLAADTGGNVHISYFDGTTNSLKYALIPAAGTATITAIDAGSTYNYPPVNNNTFWNYVLGRRSSLKIDSAGKVHITYTGMKDYHWTFSGTQNFQTDYLQKYATNASGGWNTYLVEVSASLGYNSNGLDTGRCSLSVDANKNVHISYYDLRTTALKYATNVQNPWSTYTLDMVNNVGQYTSIAANSSSKAFISYYDSTGGGLKFATNTSGVWAITGVDPSLGQNVGQYSAIAQNGATSQIAYYNATTGDLKFSSGTIASWTTSTLDSASDVGQFAAIALDASGKAHISYRDAGTNQDLLYITNASGSWVKTTIDSLGDMGYHTSITVDSASKQHIAYSDAYGHLKYATNTSGSWAYSAIATGSTSTQLQYQYTSIKTIGSGATGTIYVTYYDAINGDLRLATRPSGSTNWTNRTLDTAGDVGSYASMALDSNGKMHISYYDATNQTLRYATNNGGPWRYYVVDNQGSGSAVGKYTSIAVDSANKVHISYYDSTNGRLKYATTTVGGGGVAADQSVPSMPTGVAATASSISSIDLSWNASSDGSNVAGYRIYRDGTYVTAVTTTGYSDTTVGPGSNFCYAIVAYDSNNNESPTSATACAVIPLDQIPVQAVSMKIDANGKIHIAYRDTNDHSIKYTSNVSGIWTKETVTTIVATNSGPSLALDAANKAHLAYATTYAASPYLSTVRYTTNASGSWSIDVPVDQTTADWYIGPLNIQIGPGSLPHIAYALSTGSVKHALYTGATWTSQTVGPASGNVPGLGFAVDNSGHSHLAYRASYSSATVYATNASGTWVTTDADPDDGVASLVLDSFGNVHIAYSQYGNSYDLFYVTNASGTWKTTMVDTGTFFDAQMAIGPGNVLHIAYYDGNTGNIKYATNSTGTWSTKQVIRGGYPVSIVVDSNNVAYIAFTSNGVSQGLYLMQVR